MHHHYQITESNFDYIFTITSEFYTTFYVFMMLTPFYFHSENSL